MGAHFAHFRIGFYGEYGVPIFQKKAGKDARAGSDVGDDVMRLQATFAAEKVQNLRRISWAIADVIFHPIGKTRRWRLAHNFLVYAISRRFSLRDTIFLLCLTGCLRSFQGAS
jgi:hypothetical protein